MVVTTDSEVYNSWQVQVCYHWYRRVKEMHPDSDLGGFTRLLHTGKPDALMDKIPTVVVDPEPAERHRGYKVIVFWANGGDERMGAGEREREGERERGRVRE